jgi:glutaminyl-peptide cyclotransferase
LSSGSIAKGASWVLSNNMEVLASLLTMKRLLFCVVFVILSGFILCSSWSGTTGQHQDRQVRSDIPVYTYRIVRTYPHDRNAFTQGLVFEKGYLYEGTGLQGSSSIRQVDLKTGRILKIYYLNSLFFGEGLTIFGNKIIQLTYTSHVGFVYDKSSFKLIKEFTYPTEGWGLTHNGKWLIMSDGTSTLHFLEPTTFKEIKTITVHDHRGAITALNELEYVQGEVFANIWQEDRIARINPATGQVTGWIELQGLLKYSDHTGETDVLNGIAYDAVRHRLFVTGKLWPKLFEIELKRLR